MREWGDYLVNFSRSQTLFRSLLAPLEKGGTEPKRVEVPLFKGDLGGSTPGFIVKRTRFRFTEFVSPYQSIFDL
jgi:hypothetical protein